MGRFFFNLGRRSSGQTPAHRYSPLILEISSFSTDHPLLALVVEHSKRWHSLSSNCPCVAGPFYRGLSAIQRLPFLKHLHNTRTDSPDVPSNTDDFVQLPLF
ncbi:hypothetical protein GYMLUDRAFT_947783 [Collybiopsis luxurians FD-317 M1]|uniref:Uncharacterized protein n=1 Tax=Collybiopsis luxurians FD-317 M1 TaxID=944289 RepID=A0A0D0BTH9_9AGAR|nr:hypothetical protein GYMLUDRAFT_947783 [Collybiopsis luxurians FD-317 M1]